MSLLDFGFYNMDCLEGMRQFPDKFFDLAIVDPPYGGGAKSDENAKIIGGGTDWEHKRRSRFGGWFNRYHIDTTPETAGGGH